ncbi:MAG: glycosyltransferase family 4 protein [Candidatus Bathyarchaeia archaeon]|jgi:glycosyltransferase involved in cell wall biosynthesis
MKILLVCEGLSSKTVLAQPWRHVIEVATRMKSSGDTVEIISNAATGLAITEEILGVPVYRVKKGLFFESQELLTLLNAIDVDVINWHGSDLLSALHFWRLRKKINKKIVWTVHSGKISFSDFEPLSISDKLRLYKFWNNLLNAIIPKYFIKKWINIPQLKIITTLSERTQKYIEKLGTNKKVVTIRSGVDTSKYHPAIAEEISVINAKLGFNKEPVVLYFGPLSSFRGADTFILALPEILKVYPSINIVILARNYTGKEEETRISKLIPKAANVKVISGVLSQPELIQYLQASTIIVLPFKFWPQVECPLTILESMAIGKIVISTNIGAIPELIRNNVNGFLIEPGNVSELKNAIIKSLSDIAVSNKVNVNASFIIQQYDWGRIAEDTLRTLKESFEGVCI